MAESFPTFSRSLDTIIDISIYENSQVFNDKAKHINNV